MLRQVFSATWSDGIEVRWRSLSLEEFRRFRGRNVDERILWAEIYEACLVAGPSLNRAPAGVVAFVGKTELEQNPFNGKFRPIQAYLGQAREAIQSNYLQIARAVLSGTFRYTFEEIDAWPPELFFERLAQAEMLTGVPVNPSDPNVKQDKKSATQPRNRKPLNEAQRKVFERKYGRAVDEYGAPLAGETENYTWTR